jgi:U3 small nucleolar RNA-associated protein 5
MVNQNPTRTNSSHVASSQSFQSSSNKRSSSGKQREFSPNEFKSNARGKAASAVNGVKALNKSKVDESRAIVVGGLTNGESAAEVIDISSGVSESSDYESDEEEDAEIMENSRGGRAGKVDAEATAQTLQPKSLAVQAEVAAEDAEMEDAEEEPQEPSFGDLVQAVTSEPIDVEAAFAETAPSKSLIQTSTSKSVQPPSANSLGTVLSQSLRTNDTNLLESCLHTTELPVIRATIQRLESPLAATLLQKLADRLHRRPGRSGSLMTWVQWTLVAHGGYLATQPDLMKKLGGLYRVVSERANGLKPLLALKGKLDMLDAQMQIRKSMQTSTRSTVNDPDDEEAVIWVEGEEDSSSEESDEEDVEEDDNDSDIDMADDDVLALMRQSGTKAKSLSKVNGIDLSDSEDEMPTTVNGIDSSAEEEESDGSGDSLIDDEAEESDMDSENEEDEDEVDHDDVDIDESDDDGPPPAKRPATGTADGGRKKGGMFSRR